MTRAKLRIHVTVVAIIFSVSLCLTTGLAALWHYFTHAQGGVSLWFALAFFIPPVIAMLGIYLPGDPFAEGD